jgi:glutathione S-transferase
MQDKPKASSTLAVWQFRLSLYPEKVRWALDYKGIPHILHSLLPGLHIPQMLLWAGQRTLPVMTQGHKVVKGSAAIIDYLEHHYPDLPLYPADPALRQQALALQQQFDELGVHARRAFFWEFLPATDLAADLFSLGYPAWVRQGYRAMFPLTRLVMQLDMRITRASAEEGCRCIQEALDFVASQQGPEGYLVGKQFSIADLTAAVVLFPMVFPEQYPVAWPTSRPACIEQWLSKWQGHAGALWVSEMYRRHRGSSCAIEDRNG